MELPFLVVALLSAFHLVAAVDPGDCPSGTQWDKEAKTCLPCQLGFYRTRGLHLSCQKCPVGHITSVLGTTSKDDCNVLAQPLESCPSGSEWVSEEESCQPCSLGFYRQKGVNYWCVRCPHGTTTATQNATSVALCNRMDCPSGTDWDIKLKKCELCPIGTYRIRGDQQNCTRCPDNKMTRYKGSIAASFCVLDPISNVFTKGNCPVGSHWDAVSSSCKACSKGQFRGIEDRACVSCPSPLTTSTQGSTHIRQCLQPSVIVDGLSVPSIKVECPAGTEWQLHNVTGCRLCQPGTYRTNTSEASCSGCFGYMGQDPAIIAACSNKTQAFLPASCPSGSDWSASDVTCRLCPLGTYRARGIQEKCTPCPPKHYSLFQGSSSAKHCANISDTNFPIFQSDSCPSGSEWNNTVSGCVPCLRGSYRERSQHATCIPCFTGFTTLTTGAGKEDLCNIPREGAATMPLSGEGCEEGYTYDSERRRCTICSIGTYKPHKGRAKCSPCPADASGRRSTTLYRGASKKLHCFFQPRVRSYSPQFGPMAGGTSVNISMEHANIQRVALVTICKKPCHITHRSPIGRYVVCQTSVTKIDTEGNVKLVFANDYTTESDPDELGMFGYGPNPQITSINRQTAMASGGVMVKVTGHAMTSVARPVMTLTRDVDPDQHVESVCQVKGVNEMMCPVPDMLKFLQSVVTRIKRYIRTDQKSSSRPKSMNFNVGFKLDGVKTYEDLSKALPGKGSIKITSNPEYLPFTEKNRVREYTPGKSIIIKGKHLTTGCMLSDVTVTIGHGVCQTTALTATHLTCKPPVQKPAPDSKDVGPKDTPNVKIKVGRLQFHIGYLRYLEPETVRKPLPGDSRHIALPLALVGALLLVVIVALCVVYMYRKKRVKKGKAKTVGDGGLYRSQSVSSGTSSSTALPPLPIYSVFGPKRIQGKDVSTRQMALPSNQFSLQEVEQSLKIGLMDWYVEPAQVALQSEIKSFDFGSLWKGQFREKGWFRNRPVMVKMLHGSTHICQSEIASFFKEGTTLKGCEHPNIMKLMGVTFGSKDRSPYVITECAGLGDLKTYISDPSKSLSHTDLLLFGIQIADGMTFLASQDIVHSDLATRNCWMEKSHVVKIGDSALSRDMFMEDYFELWSGQRSVSVRWMALESFKDNSYTTHSDAWSFGVLMWEIFTRGQKPYRYLNDGDVPGHVIAGGRLHKPDHVSSHLYTIMCKCWESSPINRPDFFQVSRCLRELVVRV